MKKTTVALALLLATAAASAAQAPRRIRIVEVDGIARVEGEYVVRLRAGGSFAGDAQALAAAGFTLVREMPRLGLACVRAEEAAPRALLERGADAGLPFEVVEPNYVYHHMAAPVPSDPRFGSQWGLDNTGQSGGRADADIDAPEAWEIRSDASPVTVAVIDTGIDLGHPDLMENLWVNPGEVAGNGVDDDGNGYVDDVHGWNFVSGGAPEDDHRHGTHVAGTVGAVGNNAIGVSGVAWRARLMACKFLDKFGSGTLDRALEATAYAIDNGARVLSNSWGGGGPSTLLEEQIRRALAAGAVYVAAAGNDGSNNDGRPVYPASFEVANVISVAALDRQQRLASFSNYGLRSVHLGAPGMDVLSTLPRSRNSYGELSGTSMATPHVSGAIALLLAEHPGLTPVEVVERLRSTVDPAPSLAGKSVFGGRLNVRNALTGQAGEPLPGPEPDPPGCAAGTAGAGRSSAAGLVLPLLPVLVFAGLRRRRRLAPAC